jgi:hypothetical protein
MDKTNVLIELANQLQFQLFGNFLRGHHVRFLMPDRGTLQYECALDDLQLMIAKTQFKSIVTETEMK